MITSMANQKVKNLSLLLKKARARKEQGVFVAEGRKMVKEAPPEQIQEIYVSESFFKCENHKAYLEGKNYEVLSDAVFCSVSDTKTPQGILCLVSIPSYSVPELLKKENGLFLFAESIQDPGNLGTMIRMGEGAGVTGIIVNKTTADVYSPKTVRSTMGSIYRVPVAAADDFKNAVCMAKEQGIHLYAAHLKGSVLYDEPDYRRAAGFLIGNEGSGLTEASAALADGCVRIPMEGKVESLNAAIAASLLLYEAARQRRK